MGIGTAVVIVDKDGGQAVELGASGDIPVYIKTITKSSVTLHRYGVAGTTYYLNQNDTVVPSVGSGIDLSPWGYAKISCLVSGDNPSWDIVPLVGSPDSSTYTSGDTRTVTGNSALTLEIAGCNDFYMLCRNSSGTNPGIKVYVQGYNL